MFSKTTQPAFKNFPSNYSPYDVKYAGIVKNPSRSKAMAFSNKRLLSFSWERDSRWAVVLQNVLSH